MKKKKTITKVKIRDFNRNMYNYISSLPIVVVNARTKKEMFVIISVEEGKKVYEI